MTGATIQPGTHRLSRDDTISPSTLNVLAARCSHGRCVQQRLARSRRRCARPRGSDGRGSGDREGEGGQRPLSVHRGRHALHVGDDRPPRPGDRMAGWAPTHGASPSVRTLARAHHQCAAGRDRHHAAVARATAASRCPRPRPRRHEDDDERHGARDAHARHAHRGADDSSSTPREGAEFDRLFLTFMIQHHSGAVSMVQELFGTYGAGAGRDSCSSSRPTSTSIRRPRSPAWRRCSPRCCSASSATDRPSAGLPSPARPIQRNSIHVDSRRHRDSRPSRRRARRSAAAGCSRPRRARRRAPRPVEHVDRRAEPRSARRPQGRAAWTPAKPSWNLKVLSKTPPSAEVPRQHQLRPGVHRPLRDPGQLQRLPDLGHLESERSPTLKTAYYCPASQSDVSVYKNLLFVSGEGITGRLDCGGAGREGHGEQGAAARPPHLRHHRHRATRRTSATCRRAAARTRTRCSSIRRTRTTSTSTSRARPRVRSPSELAGCVDARCRDKDPNSALFRIEVIKVPLAHPEQAAIVSSPRIFNDLVAPPRHGEAPADIAARRRQRRRCARAQGAFIATIQRARAGRSRRASSSRCSTASSKARTAPAPRRRADSAALRAALPADRRQADRRATPGAVRTAGPTQCHDITVYPAIGLRRRRVRGLRPAARHHAIRRTRSASAPWPTRTSPTGTRPRSTTTAPRSCSPTNGAAAAQPKCRATDKKEWGADAIFTIADGKMQFQSYYKMPGAADDVRELRRAQRLADPDPGPRRDGAGVVSGRHLGVRLDRRRASEGDRLLRSRPGGLDAAWRCGGSWSVVLVQRRDRQLRDRARPRHLRAHAERVHLAERDRRGEDRCTSTT